MIEYIYIYIDLSVCRGEGSSHLLLLFTRSPKYAVRIYQGHLTSKLNYKTVPVLPSLDPRLILLLILIFSWFHFYLLLYPVHPTGFSFFFFPGFLAIFIFLSLNNNNNNLLYLPWLPCHFYLVVIEQQLERIWIGTPFQYEGFWWYVGLNNGTGWFKSY